MTEKYLYIGGAYGDTVIQFSEVPCRETMEQWSIGEAYIFKITEKGEVFEPDGSGNWVPVKEV